MKPHRDLIQATTLSAHCPHAVSAGVCGEAYSVIIVHQPATQRSNSLPFTVADHPNGRRSSNTRGDAELRRAGQHRRLRPAVILPF